MANRFLTAFWALLVGTIAFAIFLITILANSQPSGRSGSITCYNSAGVEIINERHVPNIILHNVHGITFTNNQGNMVQISSPNCLVIYDTM